MKKQVEDVCTQQSNFSELFYAIGEQISSQTNWILGDKFTEVLDLIDDPKQQRIITIDNIFTVIFRRISFSLCVCVRQTNIFCPHVP